MEVIYLALWCAVGAAIGVVIVNVYARGPPDGKDEIHGSELLHPKDNCRF